MTNSRTMTPADFDEKWTARLMLLGHNGIALESEERIRGLFAAHKATFHLPEKLTKMLAEWKSDYEAVRAFLAKPESPPIPKPAANGQPQPLRK